MEYIISLDQGTTSSRAIVFDCNGTVVGVSQKEFPQYYPQPGWVEHDPMEILNSQIEVLREAINQSGVALADIQAIGITNQRETTIVWDRHTGKPVHNAIVWQCRRTADTCDQLKADGYAEPIRDKTGLVIDAYFSGTKVKWILDHVEGARQQAEAGNLLFGTVDTWLIWNLTKERRHCTDYSNASRTMMYNIHTLQWDDEILRTLNIPSAMLPQVKESSADFGMLDASILGAEIPIYGVAGDQQAALFGQACYQPGMIKNTYGTGCFVLMNTGQKAIASKNNLLTTIAWGLQGQVTYALEGSIFMGGATIQWLRDELKIIQSAPESEDLAAQLEDNEGVYMVPAFTGLGAPWWDMYARGTLLGMSRGSGRAHVARAALESIAYQSRDVMDCMAKDADMDIVTIKVDGGASANNLLMQFQSDILGVDVERPQCIETTALGVMYLAGLKAGVFQSLEDITTHWQVGRRFEPVMIEDKRQTQYAKWHRAVQAVQFFAEDK